MKKYNKQRYIFFWSSILVYFVPYIIVTACLLPFVKAGNGTKWGMGIAVVAINALPFIAGVFKGFRAHFPFFNSFALIFIVLGSFFTTKIFSNYVYTFMTIEAVVAVCSIIACVLWGLHLKYKRQAQTVKTVLKSGVLEANK